VWDPYLQSDKDRLDRVQRKGVRFITGDYRTRTPGCVTKMLQDQKLPSLSDRRKQMRLAFMFKVVEGSVPAISPTEYLTPKRPRRAIRTRTFDNCVTDNILENQVTNNSKCFKVPISHRDPFKHSFFVQTVIDWNHLDEDCVTATSVEAFRASIEGHCL